MSIEQVHSDTGAAPSLMNCGFTLTRSIGMLIIAVKLEEQSQRIPLADIT